MDDFYSLTSKEIHTFARRVFLTLPERERLAFAVSFSIADSGPSKMNALAKTWKVSKSRVYELRRQGKVRYWRRFYSEYYRTRFLLGLL